MSHRCEAMDDVETIGSLAADLVPTAPRTVSLTRAPELEQLALEAAVADAQAWVLQLCTGRATIVVFVHFCPFCGANLRAS